MQNKLLQLIISHVLARQPSAISIRRVGTRIVNLILNISETRAFNEEALWLIAYFAFAEFNA